MKISQIIHWLLRMFVYACIGTSATLLLYDFENNSLPGGINQRTWTRHSKAKQYISSMNRRQRTYYLENGNFSNSIDNLGDNLGLSIKTNTNNYSYRILSPMNPVQNVEELKPSPLDEKSKIVFATPQKPELKSYMGIAWTFQMSDGNLTINAILCESGEEEILYPSTVTKVLKEEVSCPPGFEALQLLIPY